MSMKNLDFSVASLKKSRFFKTDNPKMAEEKLVTLLVHQIIITAHLFSRFRARLSRAATRRVRE